MLSSRAKRWLSAADVVIFPSFILWFIWQLQFTAHWTWVFFAIWIAATFLLHHDSPAAVGWRVDNLWLATRQAFIPFGLMAAGLIIMGLFVGAPRRIPPGLLSVTRYLGYFAFCLLQQVALNSVVQNRMLDLIRNEWVASVFTGVVFAACHWPNPVLVPLTFVAGTAMAWMFSRARNIIPLAVGQALLGTMVAWAFPPTWVHHLRVGPGYYNFKP